MIEKQKMNKVQGQKQIKKMIVEKEKEKESL